MALLVLNSGRSLTVSQLLMVLAPWSVIAFRSQYHFFVAMEHALGSLFTRVLVMNQLRANSIQDLLNSVIYSRSTTLAWLPSVNAALAGSNRFDACSATQCASEGSISPSRSSASQQVYGTQRFPSSSLLFLDDTPSRRKASVSQEVLTWNDTVGSTPNLVLFAGALILPFAVFQRG